MDQDKLWQAEHYPVPPITLKLTRQEAATLYVVLSDNARTWNIGIRDQLRKFVNATDTYNARLDLQPKLGQ